jgi:F-type H+-transporting ATPase subunit alpha
MNTFTDYLAKIREIGFVEEATSSLAYVTGLPTAALHEVVLFETGEMGQIISLHSDTVEVIVFTKYPVKVGTRVVRTGSDLSIPTGKELLGLLIDPFGNPIDRIKPYTKPTEIRPMQSDPKGIYERKVITKPFETGVTIVDMLVPLGIGQRELIIGDRKTGKSSFLLQAMLQQAREGTICIYAAIGKRKLDIKKIEEFAINNDIIQSTIIIASGSEDPASVIYVTPYAAMAIAEYFRDQGNNVLVILDDLITHAKFYREISLLGKRFPGRNAYPADIFYTHAKLLERAGNFAMPNGSEAAITCLPVAETVQGDLSGYIQTNLMSMTDGHVYFDIDYFAKGRRPAINPFLSVTRVGRQTQTNLKRTVSREILSFLTLREKMENFAHFGAEINAGIAQMLKTGNRIIAYFDQPAREVIPINVQLFTFTLLWSGKWDNATDSDMKKQIQSLIMQYKQDKQIRSYIDEMIASADSLNSLLTVFKKRNEWLNTIEKAGQSYQPVLKAEQAKNT